MARIYFSSRHSGNFGDHVGDDPGLVSRRRSSLARALSVPPIAFMNQVHGNVVQVITEAPTSASTCDALVTSQRGLGLAVMVADCIPLLLTSDVAVAAVHVGRAGLVSEISLKAIAIMRDLGAHQIAATVGPSICRNCYEVAPHMYQEISSQLSATATNDLLHSLDLVAGLRQQLGSQVVDFSDLHICAKESSDHFSYRREQETGRQVGVVIL